jgi:hypothetical protein
LTPREYAKAPRVAARILCKKRTDLTKAREAARVYPAYGDVRPPGLSPP